YTVTVCSPLPSSCPPSSPRTYSEPMKPAPPVTRILMRHTYSRAVLKRSHLAWGDEGDPVGRRDRLAAVAADPGRLQAVAAGLRQTDDLLSALHTDAVGHPRDPDHHHTRGPRGVPAAARRRLAARPQSPIRGPAEPGRPGSGLPARRAVHRRRPGGAGARRQHPARRPG